MNESQPPGMTARQVRTLLKVLPVALLVGLTLAIWGIYLVHFHLNLIIHGETATGKVIALERGISSSSSSPAWFPVVKFSAQNAQLVTFRHRTGRSPPAYSKGDEVPVTYLPSAPAEALIAEGYWNWLLPLLMLVIGSGLTFISLRGIVGARRRLEQLEER